MSRTRHCQPGAEVVAKAATPGSRWQTNLITKKNGQVVSDVLLHNSTYTGKAATIKRNTSGTVAATETAVRRVGGSTVRGSTGVNDSGAVSCGDNSCGDNGSGGNGGSDDNGSSVSRMKITVRDLRTRQQRQLLRRQISHHPIWG